MTTTMTMIKIRNHPASEKSGIAFRSRLALVALTALAAGPFVAPAVARANGVDAGLAASALQAALAEAVTVPGARVDVVALDRPAGECLTADPRTRMEVGRPIDGSGRVAIKLVGTGAGGTACEVWAWARVRVFAKVSVAAKAIRAGEKLGEAAVRTEEREIRSGHVPALVTASSVSDRSVGVGQMIEASAIRAPGPRAGEAIKVLILSGALAVEQTGRAVPCGRDSSCAVLPSGKHVQGTFAEGRLLVRLP